MTAEEVIERLGLLPHPEGGFYAETFRDPAPSGARSAGTAIYYLLRRGERSWWHRVDAAEIWHHYAGAPLEVGICNPDGVFREHLLLGDELSAGQRPQAVVPRDYWQSARSLGDWTLAGCTVAPGFEFAGFQLAPADWEPKG